MNDDEKGVIRQQHLPETIAQIRAELMIPVVGRRYPLEDARHAADATPNDAAKSKKKPTRRIARAEG